MKIDDIPQDNSASYHGHRKVIYGTRDGTTKRPPATVGRTKPTPPKWRCSNSMPKRRPRAKPSKDEYSPLYYHMFRCRYDETGLAMAAGVWKWQLRRHFRPEVFAKLPAKTLQKYADACQISIDDLKQTNI